MHAVISYPVMQGACLVLPQVELAHWVCLRPAQAAMAYLQQQHMCQFRSFCDCCTFRWQSVQRGAGDAWAPVDRCFGEECLLLVLVV